MAAGRGAHAAGEQAQLLAPVGSGSGHLDLQQQPLHEAVEESLFVADVPVERHRVHVEFLRYGPHRDGRQPLPGRQLPCHVQHLITTDPPWRHLTSSLEATYTQYTYTLYISREQPC